MNPIVAEISTDVKADEADEYVFGDSPDSECGYDGCYEAVFRYGLCWDHFIAEEATGIHCGCVLDESCPTCDAVAASVYGGDELPFERKLTWKNKQ